MWKQEARLNTLMLPMQFNNTTAPVSPNKFSKTLINGDTNLISKHY